MVIGGAGFVGHYLVKELSKKGREVFATKLPFEKTDNLNCTVMDLDVTDEKAMEHVINTVLPHEIYHLAAQSSVKLSWDEPQLTLNVNVSGALNLLNAVKKAKTDSYDPTVLLIGSAEEYGKVSPEECPISEDKSCHPKNVYALSKMTQNALGSIYAEAFGIRVINVRAFNHTGPMQSPAFVISDFCNQVAKIEASLQAPVISVGNLAAMRDFTDVRDIVAAYVALAEKGETAQTYNVGSGKAIRISDALKIILSQAKTEITVEKDIRRMRPSDVPLHVADTAKIKKQTGWEPSIPFEQTITDTLNYFRDIYKEQKDR